MAGPNKSSKMKGKEPILLYAAIVLNLFSFLVTSVSTEVTTSNLKKVGGVNQVLVHAFTDLDNVERVAESLVQSGNNVFVTSDPDSEMKIVDATLFTFNSLVEDIQSDLGETTENNRNIGATLRLIKTEGAALASVAALVFTDIKGGHLKSASKKMADMGRIHSQLRERFAQFRAQLQQLKGEYADTQIQSINSFSNWAHILILFSCFFSVGLIIVGRAVFARLRESEDLMAFYKLALDQFAIVATTDKKGRITYANEAFVKISGYSAAELVGQDHRILNSGKMGKAFFKEMWDTIAQGKIWRGEVCNRAKDGRLYWVDSVIVPFRGTDGRISQYIAIRNEITARKSMEEQLWANNELRRAILESANFSVISTDLAGVIQTFNKTAEKMLGYTTDEVIGKANPGKFHDPEEIEARSAILSYELGTNVEPGFDVFVAKARHLQRPDENEWTYIRKDGTRFPVRLSVTSLRGVNGELVGYLGIATDISEAKRTHNELLQANRAAVAAAKAKTEFLANMSHEIRTPMNGVIGMCNLLLGEATEKLQIERLKIIQNCGNTLLDLINDILDFSKLEAGKIELENEAFPLHSTAQEIVELLCTKASEKGLVISYRHQPDVPSWVLGDVTRFRQILTNLVGNAIKFTEKGSVLVTSSAKQKTGNLYEVEFAVKDTGAGIPLSLRNRLFASFSQADASTTRRFGGTGLGLVISKGLCEKMGGTIRVESEVGHGSTFTFSIVVEKTEAKELSGSANPFLEYTQGEQLQPLRILVAEDNRVNQLVTVGFLEKLGHKADVAGNGLEALACLKNQPYDLILMDCHMPEMDGFEATRRICEKYPRPDRPWIVALTASTMKENVDKCYASGMDAFLNKPVTIAALVRAINECRHQLQGTRSVSQQYKSMDAQTNSTQLPYDQPKFLSNFEGAEDIAARTIHMFLESVPSLMASIRLAGKQQDGAALQAAAHNLKGVASNFCADTVTDLARQLEKRGASMMFQGVTDLTQHLEFEVERLVLALRDSALLKTG